MSSFFVRLTVDIRNKDLYRAFPEEIFAQAGTLVLVEPCKGLEGKFVAQRWHTKHGIIRPSFLVTKDEFEIVFGEVT